MPQTLWSRLKSLFLIETGTPRTAIHGFFGVLYPAYVRGEAFLALRFNKILGRPGLVLSDPVAALARLQLARALSQSPDKANAKAAYQDVINLWKDADKDLPVLLQAIAENAKL